MKFNALTVEECDIILQEWFHLEKDFETPNEYIGSDLKPIQSLKNISTSHIFVEKLQKLAEEKYGKLNFENTFMRSYPTGSELKIHTDRGELDVTLSICLWKPKDLEYPIFVANEIYEGKSITDDLSQHEIVKENSQKYNLNIGEGCFLEGKKYPHWRPIQPHDKSFFYIFYHWSLQK